jgi:hypothetical protein
MIGKLVLELIPKVESEKLLGVVAFPESFNSNWKL